MPRKKVTDGSGGRKRAAGKKRGRDEFSSDDDLELDGSPGSDGGANHKRGPNKGGAKSQAGAAAVVVTEPEHTKEKIKLEGSKAKGQLLIFGATNWDLIGRKEVPKQQAAYRNLGQNLWGPHKYGCLSGIQIRTVASGPCSVTGHNSDGKYIARAQRIEYDCELVPRRIAIFIEKTKDGQVLPVPNVVVRDIACGINHTLVLDSQKRVFTWGFGGYGRLGHTEQKDELVPRLVKLFDFPGRGASQIYAGATCSFAVSEMGGLYFWGATNTSRDSTMYPKTVQDLCGWKVRNLACGKSSIIAAADESTISWGPSPTFGELGYGESKAKSSTTAQEVKTLDGIYSEQVAMGYSHTLVVAREESEQDKERLKKLPEYNPRTL
ncbi:PREDICTED: protein RCC2 [Nanorana parkeri]|uniref:protein RCC2 n=1 Tax=Nanorana parkeri TaxID=125878 RepID=UPI0008548847|nr:PREDICTED: protein RCC2 [Nanorana parkeri]